MMQKLDNFPRIIVDLDGEYWQGVHTIAQVAQLLIIKDGKKCFLNIKLIKYDGDVQVVAQEVRTQKRPSGAAEFYLHPDMPVNDDEENAINCFKLELG